MIEVELEIWKWEKDKLSAKLDAIKKVYGVSVEINYVDHLIMSSVFIILGGKPVEQLQLIRDRIHEWYLSG